MKIKIIFILALLFSGISVAQEKDILTENKLTEVVVTGQFKPQSIKKSVLNVRVITQQDIQNLAVNSLSDVLNQYLNITIKPSGNDGRSTVSMFGLDAQYFKIVVDNIPLVNEGGLGNNIDLSQINLNDIEQIEIIEGSMGVTHGANAVSGILNIITKTSSKHKWVFSATNQEETVGKEYALFDKGRHIQAIKVAHTLNKNWFVSLGFNRNDFAGFLEDKKGKNYYENDSFRGYTWLPKEQVNATSLVAYKKNDFSFFYKFEFLDEKIDFYNSTVQSGYNTTLGSYRYANDKRYFTNRFFHHLNSTGKLFSHLRYTISVSHQKQERNVENFRYYLSTQEERNTDKMKDQSMEVFYSTGTVSNFFKNSKVDLQLGYELVHNLGFSLVQEANSIFVPVRKKLENYDFFASSEIKFSDRFLIRPGIRFSQQTIFKDQYASSFGLRYLFDKGIELRSSFGKSFRTPNFQELYSKLIFDGHFFIGNENLIPETSASYEISIKKKTFGSAGWCVSNTITSSFLDVKDRIDMALIGINKNTGNPEYHFINISNYKMWNVSSLNQLEKGNLTFHIGASFVGISQNIQNQVFTSDDKFLYSFNWNSSISYAIPIWKTTLSAYYKHNGKTQQFIQSTSEYAIATIDPSSWLALSARKYFFNNKFEVTMGIRNVFDIKKINQTQPAGGFSHATSREILMGYGRSYFLKLTYNFNL